MGYNLIIQRIQLPLQKQRGYDIPKMGKWNIVLWRVKRETRTEILNGEGCDKGEKEGNGEEQLIPLSKRVPTVSANITKQF